MKRAAVAIVAAAALAAPLGCDTGPAGERYFAVLSGANITPPVVTTAGGTVSLVLKDGVLSYDVIVQFGTNVTMAHLHAGAAGEDGPVVVTLYSGPTAVVVNGRLASGQVHAADLTTLSMDSLRTLMRSGHAYADVHTTSNPAGELRGQITVE